MPTLGYAAIWTAALAAVLSCGMYVAVWRGRTALLAPARVVYSATFSAILIAAASLMYLILTHNYAVSYVASYSSSDLPLYYLISTFWAGQEGTFLLWTIYLSIIGLFLIRSARVYEPGVMFFLSLFIFSILLILIKKSPFALSATAPADGSGLNPLLQDYWMVIHPPTMFLGFSLAAVPFLFAMTALVNKKYGDWTLAARRWTIVGWMALGLAIIEGGYWAYKVLGWGGFWAWDPVENSSLIPWLFLTAQLHTLSIQQRRQSLTRFALLMVCLTFWSVLYGTFLTRSGVLADFSVHSFVNLGINNFLLAGMGLFLIIGIGLIAYRWRDIGSHFPFDTIISRDYLITLGVIILVVGAAVVLLGTSAPLLTRLTEKPSAVSASYYSVTMVPVGIVIAFLMALYPFFRWGRGVSGALLLGGGALIAAIPTAAVMINSRPSFGIALLLFAVLWGLISNFIHLIQGLSKGTLLGHTLVHVGVLCLMLGAVTSNSFEKKFQVMMERGKTTQIDGYNLSYTEREPHGNGEWFRVAVSRGDEKFDAFLIQEQDSHSGNWMRKPHIQKYLSHDFYLSPVNMNDNSQPTDNHPGLITLGKGQDTTIAGYKIAFSDFNVEHGEAGPKSLAAQITITHDGQSESVQPTLNVTANGLEPKPVSFDNAKGSIFIAGVHPDQGQILLQVVGDFVPAATDQPSTPDILVAELSIKPWISFFWGGAALTLLGGLVVLAGKPGGRIPLRELKEVFATPVDEAAQPAVPETVVTRAEGQA
jgi:cytochrome c-type biogenesis protein CcmF